ncbi:MAG: tetratricopeptide repeat protein [Phycisphaerae bacterium]|nr:tetratricopeptide repeat protein [Phycisphaerae bacterium]
MPRRDGPSNRAAETVDRPGAPGATIALGLLVAVVTFAAFAPALRHGYVNWDDPANILQNRHYRGFSAENLRWMFTTFLLGPYQPLSWMSLALDYVLWGDSPAGHHFGNVLYHTLAAVAFYLAASRLFSRAFDMPRSGVTCRIAAAAAALLFAAHPLRVESVAWVTERRDCLSGFLFAVTMLLYLRALETQGTRRFLRTWLAIIAFALCLLAKATAMLTPLVLLLIDAWPLRRFRRDSGEPPAAILAEKIPFFVLAAAAAIIAVFGQSINAGMRTLEQIDLLTRVQVAAYGTCFYVWKSIVPAGLIPLYLIPVGNKLHGWQYAAPVIVVIAVSIAALLLRRRHPWIAVAWFSYLLLLAPVSGLAQSGPQIAADRYSYLPGMVFGTVAGGAMLALARSAARGVRSPHAWNASVVAAAAAISLLAVRAAGQTHLWKDSETLWRYTLEHDPTNAIAYGNLGDYWFDQGDYERAREYFEAAARFNPTLADHHFNLAAVYDKLKRTDDAVAAARRALELNPDIPLGHYQLGSQLLIKRDYEAAANELRIAVEKNPDYPGAHMNLGQALIRLGRFEEGDPHVQQAIRLTPRDPELYLKGSRFYGQIGRVADAIGLARAGVEAVPTNAELVQRLAWLLSTSTLYSERNGAEALMLADQLCAATNFADPMALATRAAALAESGRYQEAHEVILDAIRRCPPDFPKATLLRFEMMEKFFSADPPRPFIDADY